MSVNQGQVKGQIKEVGGMIKEVTSKIIGDDKLEHKGKIRKARSKAQAAIGDIKEDVKEAVKSG